MNGRDEELSWIRDAEALLASLRGVRRVNIAVERPDTALPGAADAPPEIAEIHILSDGERPPKQIVRDVRSALMAAHRVDVDYRKISIVQRRQDPPSDGTSNIIELVVGPEVAAPPPRIRFGGVTVAQNALRCSVQVELALWEREIMGEAEGPVGRLQVPRLIAEATLRGLERLIADDYRLALGHLEIVNLGGDTIVLVCVKFIGGRRQQSLSGSCIVDHDLQQAVVYASLAALNRILGRLPIKEPVEYELRPTSVSTGPDWRGF